MDIEETKQRFLALAKQRLNLIPGAYDVFCMHHCFGSALPLPFLLAGSISRDALCHDAMNLLQAFDRRAIEYVDAWADKNCNSHVTPLVPRVAPLSPRIGSDVPAPAVELNLRKARPVDPKPPSPPDELAPPAPTKPLQIQVAQENEILDAIRVAGYDLLSLPKRQSGKRGLKSEIRGRLVGNSRNFPTDGSQFDKAWHRLRASDQIVD